METSASKRRKTSPQGSVAIHHNNGAAHGGAGQGGTKSTTPTGSPPGPARQSDRPSFASPTRASLARHNPDVLQRRRPGRPDKKENHALQERASDPSSGDVSIEIQQPLELEAEEQGRGGAPWSTVSRPPGKVGTGLSAKPKRSPNKFPPRPLPPPGPEEEEIVNPLSMRGRSGLLRAEAAQAQVPEPELPPTPEHARPDLGTPSSGIHNTPSRRPRRARELRDMIRSSPSKPGPTALFPSKRGPPPSKGKAGQVHLRRSARTSPLAGPVEVETPQVAATCFRDADEAAATRALRSLKPFGQDAEKERRRDALLAEVVQLQADLKALTEQNECLDRPGTPTPAPIRVLDAVRRHLLPSDLEPAPDPDAQWLAMALNPVSFLPFGKPTESRPDLFASDSLSKEEASPPVSHHPVVMSAEEELPFLRVFTPLAFTSQITVLPRASKDDSLLQKHTILASSAAPAGLFTAQIEMIVDVKSHRIRNLSVPRIDPAASPELGPFVASITANAPSLEASDGGASENAADRGRSLRNNVSVLSWAMGEWVRVSTQRARFWRVLERELATKEDIAEAVAQARARKRAVQPNRKRDRSDNDENNSAATDPPALAQSECLSRANLLPYMGRTSMDLGIPAVAEGDGTYEAFGLRVQWRIGFDWTGRKADTQGNLADIPALFGKLIQGDDDPIVAVKAIVALLSGNAS